MSPRCALVTGGSRGIGAAIVERLAARGMRVLAVGRDMKALREVGAQPGVNVCQADLATDEGIMTLAREADEVLGEIDVLVHSAGQVIRRDLLEMSPEAIDEHLLIGLSSPMKLTAHLGKSLTHGSSVIFLSSTLAARPAAARSVYAAVKAALEGLTRALALELGPQRVRVNSIAPAVVPTGMILDGLPAQDDIRADALEELRELHLLGRLGRVGDIADAVEYLIDAKFVSGTVLTVDGGLTLT